MSTCKGGYREPFFVLIRNRNFDYKRSVSDLKIIHKMEKLEPLRR